jgi:hypothetical protein
MILLKKERRTSEKRKRYLKLLLLQVSLLSGWRFLP